MNVLQKHTVELLQLTYRLEKELLLEEPHLDIILDLIDQREILMGEIDALIAQGERIDERSKKYLEEAYKLHGKQLILLKKHHEEVMQKMGQLQQRKTATNVYNFPKSAAGYGAFFDKKQ
ncbi:hypothetical protein O3V59_06830 [Brevibacillus thermoruber]|jgi:hypothetical protein|uniref:Flagellar protein FliT n=1 Tax=Brevibacillus thermoruber TaxID=33942 RepID=A0A9X3TP08_9BACL|nr:hypothetical protein [Brevibacillus thermoruber]MDA5108067.1 hypothetical protein [Brevibacillus thermoruber]